MQGGARFPVASGLARPVVGVVGGGLQGGPGCVQAAAESLLALVRRCDAVVVGGAVGVAWAAAVGGVDVSATEAAWARAAGAGGVSPLREAWCAVRAAAAAAVARGVRVYGPCDFVTGAAAFASSPPELVEYDEADEADAVEESLGLSLDGRPVGEEEEEEEAVDSDDDDGWVALRDARAARRERRRRRVAEAAEAAAARREAEAEAAGAWSAQGGALPGAAASRALVLAATGGKGTVEAWGAGKLEYAGEGGAAEEDADTVAALRAVRSGAPPALPAVRGVVLDVGPRSRERAAEVVEAAGTVVWAGGAMGVVECDDTAEGTREVAAAVEAAARNGALVVVAGGSAVASVRAAGLEESDSTLFVAHAAPVRALLVGNPRACAPVASLTRLGE